VISLVLRPDDLLNPDGFEEGLLCRSVLDELRGPGTGIPQAVAGYDSGYASPRHLLRHLVRAHLLPLFPWASSMVVYSDPHGSPVRLWLYDDDGCPLAGRQEQVRAAPSVLLGEEDLRRGVASVYPLRTMAQVVLYRALDMTPAGHETALALIAPFLGLDDDVLLLAAELYPVALSHVPPFAVAGGIEWQEPTDVLALAGLLFDVVASARSLVH